VNVVRPEIDETGLVLVAPKKIERLIYKECRAVPTFDFVVRGPDPVGGSDVGVWFRAFPCAGVFVEAVSGERRSIGDVATAAHMPFAEVAGGVTGGFQSAGEGRRGRVQKIRLLALSITGARLEETGDVPARGEHTGREAGARRRTNRSGAVVFGEASSLARQAIEVGSRCKLAAIAADIAVAHIIAEDEEDVRPGGGTGERCREGEGKRKDDAEEAHIVDEKRGCLLFTLQGVRSGCASVWLSFAVESRHLKGEKG
jgi:hypothetical protein